MWHQQEQQQQGPEQQQQLKFSLAAETALEQYLWQKNGHQNPLFGVLSCLSLAGPRRRRGS